MQSRIPNSPNPMSPPATRRISLGGRSVGQQSTGSLTPRGGSSSAGQSPLQPPPPPPFGACASSSFSTDAGNATGRDYYEGEDGESSTSRVVKEDQREGEGGDARWKCGQCGKTFTRRGHLKRHEENHFESRRYQCDFCNKSFARNDVMLRHRAVHQPGLRVSDNSRSEAALKRARRACTQCSSVKMKCDGGQPCGRCSQKIDGGFNCSYRTTAPLNRDDMDTTAYSDQSSTEPRLHRFKSSGSTTDYRYPHQQPRLPQGLSPLQNQANPLDYAHVNQQQHRYPHDSPAYSGSGRDSSSMPGRGGVGGNHVVAASSPANLHVASNPPEQISQGSTSGAPFNVDPYDTSSLQHIADDSFLEPWSSDGVFDWLFAAQQISLPWQAGEMPAIGQADGPFAPHIPSIGDPTGDLSDTPPLVAAAAAAAAQEETGTRTARHSPQDATTTHQWPNGLSVPPTLELTELVAVILAPPSKETRALEDTFQVRALEAAALDGLLMLPAKADLQPQQVEATEASLSATSASTMNLFVQLYFEHFDRICPILHRPTFDPNTCNAMLLGAVCAIGATYSRIPNTSDFAGMLMTLVNRAIFSRLPHDTHIFRNVAVFQALLLNFNFFRGSGKQRMLELAEAARSPLTTMTRKSRLFERSRQPTNRHTNAASSLSPAQSETGLWLDWVEEETGRRTAWYYFIADLELSAIWKLPPSFALNELKAELPQDEVFWRCPTASTWMRMRPAMIGHPVYLSQLHDVLRLRPLDTPSGLAEKLDEVFGPSSAQGLFLAYSLVSLGVSLHSLETTCLSAAVASATEDFSKVCKALVSATHSSSQHRRASSASTLKSDTSAGSSPADSATAELLLRFVLLRQCLDISELQLLAGRSGRREDMQRSLQHIRGHLVREPHKLWAALIHAGRIVHLCTCHAIDSMYEGCFLFYAATTLFVCAKIWPDFAEVAVEADGGKSRKMMTVQVDSEQPLSLDEKEWLAWTGINANGAMSHGNSSSNGSNSVGRGGETIRSNVLARGESANQFAPQHQHHPSHQASHSQSATPGYTHTHHPSRHPLPRKSSPPTSPMTSLLSTPQPGLSSTSALIACITPTLAGIGDITRPQVHAGILRHFADHLLSRPARTTWPIGKLLGRIMGEMAAVFGP
ncbi:hypothetical protein BCV69DRAFT_281739 [Microstroma glucosiphilum]|uniref:Zn(2)-C6 fungal-type domain-containing protein n=1 Tax=Pseudomicrostroma glucosiphilum TaxID=1684307 RepID=A0A316UAF9_9BASI|nr:hypothetical protein BCV69DRAFT_281739 [Pseudomicrostroma glucosiphilum]PWN21814.1 hypothetical protein BCV69DRAFT_281739 [Pseudomicrostroma glucosiphilum]